MPANLTRVHGGWGMLDQEVQRGKTPGMRLVVSASASDGAARTVLVDAGFYRDKFVRQWKPTGFVKPSAKASPRDSVRCSANGPTRIFPSAPTRTSTD